MFQVNCPGCFMYALPMFNALLEQYEHQMGFLALSTAFEDFNLNTEQNTRLLIEKGHLIGETKKALNEQGIDKLPYPLKFPIGIDAMMKASEKELLIENICNLNPNYKIWSDYDKNLMNEKVNHYLNQQEKISMTFTANQFKGTPSIALFNEKHEILGSWFGHVQRQEIIKSINSFI